MFGYRVPSPDEALLIAGGRGEEGRNAISRGHGTRRLRAPVRPSGDVPDARDARGGGGGAVRHQAGDRAVGQGGDRVQGRQRSRVDRQRRAAVPLRPGSDVGPRRSHLRRSSALDRRFDDGRGDRHRAPEARHRGAGWLQGRDGQDGTDRRLAADPVDRRPGRRLHRGDGRTPQCRDPAPGEDRPGPGRPGGGDGDAGVGAQAVRVRTRDGDRASPVQGRHRQGPGRGPVRSVHCRRPRPSAR